MLKFINARLEADFRIQRTNYCIKIAQITFLVHKRLLKTICWMMQNGIDYSKYICKMELCIPDLLNHLIIKVFFCLVPEELEKQHG